MSLATSIEATTLLRTLSHGLLAATQDYLLPLIVIQFSTIVVLLIILFVLGHTRKKLQQSQKRLKAVISELPAIVWTIDPQFVFTSSSGSGLVKLGLKENEVVGSSLYTFFNTADPENPHIKFHQLALQGLSQNYETMFNDYHYEVLLRPTTDHAGRITGVLGLAQDVTERKQFEAHLEHQASYDPLTGLYNRNTFKLHLDLAMRRIKDDPHYSFGVVFIDLDSFKDINDSLGHAEGDLVLRDVADRLKHCTRPDDTLSRFGGDEFALLMHDVIDTEQAVIVAERIHQFLAKPIKQSGLDLFVNASIGISLGHKTHESASQILREVDTAMYCAKRKGIGQTEIFSDTMHEDATKTLQIKNDLRNALDKDQFILHYQPIVNMRTSEITGVEALARWLHPEHGLISPEIFIPIAEDSNLMTQLGDLIIDKATRALKKWQETLSLSPNFQMHINVSPQQLVDGDFAHRVFESLINIGVSTSNIVIELTEYSVIENYKEHANTFDELRQRGIKIAIDDFGTGYSSLQHVDELPLDMMKIDKSFVARIDEDAQENGQLVVDIVKTLGFRLGVEVTAEGIENVAQYKYLRSIGCQYAQGYYLAKPMPEDKLEPILMSGVCPVIMH